VIRIAGEHLLVVLARSIEAAARFVQGGQIELQIEIIGRDLDQVLVRLDCARVVIQNAGVARHDQRSFVRRQSFAQLDSASR
jgi:hypothetical protein